MQKIKKIVKLVCLSGLGALAGVLIFEASLQTLSHTSLGKVLPAVEPQLGQPDRDIGYAFTPDTEALWTRENRAFVTINSLGLRDHPIAKEKPENTFRVALSGDSIVEALQVETDAVFENIAEKKLHDEGQNVEIMNFAMAGNGPLRQLVRLEKFATPLQPDMTIMMMSASDFMTGEMQDDSENPGYKFNMDGDISRSYGFQQRFSQRYADKLPGRVFLFLTHHSHTFRMLYSKRSIPLLEVLGLPSHATPKSISEDISQPSIGCEEESLNKLHNFWVKKSPHKDWLVTKHFFNEVQIYAKGQKIVMALYLPFLEEHCILQNQKRREVVQSIRKEMQNHNITFYDWNSEISDFLPNSPRSESMNNLYGFGQSLGQGHLNYKGHELYARALVSVIKTARSK